MSQWFDMWSVEEPDIRPELQTEGLRESITVIVALVEEEVKRVPPNGSYWQE
jgi:hypothetical protein